ncbi:hypothetical protein A8W25_00515 [Streptomyces sp. ERV7]|uniref:DUF6234 family protein n=1 Tax=Streptomyces sp. ERV7 TaxID=1322334 RepID=UPI0007F46C68|nr:DUF6234 family protein [Streptomyces sp. ERV7]OAR26826.1 hypothetical protein A8W25_00515 [Streptomyces sp. ERV7]
MNLPVAPPAFDATTGPRQRRRTDTGVDIGVSCGLVCVELLTLVVTFGLWFLSGLDLDPGATVESDSLWGYLAAVGAVGVFSTVAAAFAARAGAFVTVISQATVATLVCVIVFGGTMAQSHEDARCRDTPSAASCED